MNRLAILLTFMSTSALASDNYTQDARALSAAALCGATNATCQQAYLTGAKTSAASKRVEATYRAIRGGEVTIPPIIPPPPPPSPPPPLSGVISDGDSISIKWSGSHTGLYASSHASVPFISLAVGGSGLNNLIARRQAVLDLKPKVFTVLIGANDLGGYASGNAYCAAVLSYVGPVRALGAKVAVGTILPQVAPSANLAQGFVAKRTEANACLRAAVGTTIDAVYDFDTVSVPLQADGVHPTDAGQAIMAPVYRATVDALLTGHPAPPPSPPPPAPPPVEVIPTPGLAPVADGLDVASFLQPAWGTGAIPASAAPDVVGAFRFICQPGQIAFDDPIVYPGQPGKSHLHQFFGNTGANAHSTYASLRTSGESTCANVMNRSAYWQPAMMNGKGMVVRPDYISIYYKRRPATDPACTKLGKACVDLPRGLRFIFGKNMLDMAAKSTGAGYFDCQGTGAVRGHYPDIVTAAKFCPVGAQLGAIISAPPCWNGKDLDSADHRSHVAYPANMGDVNSACPATHPYLIPTFTMGSWFTVDADLDRSGVWDGTFNSWHLSSDNMPGMPMKPGTSFHADWFGAWNDAVLTMWHDQGCIAKLLNCSGGDLGTGKQLKPYQPDRWIAVPHLAAIPPHP